MEKGAFSFSERDNGESSSSFKESFVGRADVIEEFDEWLTFHSSDEQCRIINYWGVGGIGKTTLCRFLRKRAESNYIVLSFDGRAHEAANVADALVGFETSCACNFNPSFALFDYAYNVYFEKKHPTFSLASGSSRSGKRTALDLGTDAIGIFDNGLTGTLINVIECAYKGISKKIRTKAVNADLRELPNRSLQEMEIRLPAYFGLDLHEMSQKHFVKPIIFIDTFEALCENALDGGSYKTVAGWISNLMRTLNDSVDGLRIVVFGREQIEWDSDIKPHVVDRRLGRLNDADAVELLKMAGLQDEVTAARVAKHAKGYPLLLSLFAEAYRAKLAQKDLAGIERLLDDATMPNSWGRELVTRLLDYLSPSERSLLRYLSLSNRFTRESASFINMRCSLGFAMNNFSEFVRRSFVEELQENEIYVLQREIAEVIRSSLKPEEACLGHKALLEFYKEELNEKPADYDTVYQLVFHAGKLMAPEFYIEFVMENASPAIKAWQISGDTLKIIELFQLIFRTVDYSNIGPDLFGRYTDMVHLGGDYRKSSELISDYLENANQEFLQSDEGLYLCARKLHHEMFYRSAADLIEEALVLRQSRKGQPCKAVIELDFLIGGNLAVLVGDFKLAFKWLDTAIEDNAVCADANLAFRVDRKRIDAMLASGNIEDAAHVLARYDYLLQEAVKDDDANREVKRYEIYLMGSLGEWQRLIGRPGQAAKLFDRMLRLSRDNGMLGWEAHAYLALARLGCAEGQYLSASAQCREALAIYERLNHAWGLANASIVADELRALTGIELAAPQFGGTPVVASELCEKMGYSYQLEFAKNGMSPDYTLLFL